MSQKKSDPDRHDKEAKMVRIRAEFNGPIAALKKRLAHGMTQIINDAVREKLEREGLWPVGDVSERGR